MPKIKIPHNFEPRAYQLNLLNALDSGVKRAFCLWHRRAGKDKVLWNYIIKRAFVLVGTHYYFLPTYTQAKKVIWDGMDNNGFKFIDHAPPDIRKGLNGQEMKITLRNGSIIQLVGTDKYDAIRGTNPKTCIFSEYSFQNPKVWEVVKPILKMNNGIAVFNTTPNGKNHAYDLFNIAEQSDDWFSEVLTVEDTGLLDGYDIQDERQSGMSEDMIQQEYYCSFESAVQGAYYSTQLKQAKEEQRITKVSYDPLLDVHTAWDLGYNDTTAIWFYQIFGKEIRLIDSYENSGEGLTHYLEYIKSKPYNYGTHYFPHDIRVTEYTTGKTREQTLREYGITNYDIVPRISVEDGIEAVRRAFNRFWFDKDKCADGLRALQDYHKEFDEKNLTFRNKPSHNWSSNYADSIRYLALSLPKDEKRKKKKVHEKLKYHPLTGKPLWT